MLLTRTGREYALRTALTDLSFTVDEPFDHVIIDCPPSLGVLTINGLTAATDLLIPLQCETLSHRGVGQLLNTVKDIQRMTNPGLHVLGVLPTLYDARTLHSRDVLDDVTDRYGISVLDPPIGRSVRFAEAPAAGRSVLATAGRTKGAQAYRQHAERIAARAG
jgi:chromosome partitioning protein